MRGRWSKQKSLSGRAFTGGTPSAATPCTRPRCTQNPFCFLLPGRTPRTAGQGGGRGHRQVAGQQVEQRRDVGAALDAGVPAQGQDAAAGRPMLPSSSWMISAGTDVLRRRCAGSSPRCRQRAGAVPAGRAGPNRADGQELLPGRAADVLDELRGVAGEVPFRIWNTQRGAPAWGPGRCRWSPRPAARRRPRRRAPALRRTARRGPRAPAVSRRTRTASCSWS